tara:strand:+ start:1038 stop:1439 length:402 start_codon:yes stop_codon:yes gene_type:complete
MAFNKLIEYAGVCPFAKESIQKGRVLGPIKGNEKVVLSLINNWDDSYEVIVVEPHKYYWKDFGKWCIENEEKFAYLDLTAIANPKQNFILIQRLSDLAIVGEKLRKETNYYDNYTGKDWAIYLRRIRLLKLIK